MEEQIHDECSEGVLVRKEYTNSGWVKSMKTYTPPSSDNICYGIKLSGASTKLVVLVRT